MEKSIMQLTKRLQVSTKQAQQNEFTPILHAASPYFYWQGQGKLSLKSFRNGKSYYSTGVGHYAVEEGKYLLLNSGQEYTITIESETPVESFCVFFPDGMIDDVLHSLATSNHRLLADPFFPQLLSLDFVEKTYSGNEVLSALEQLRVEYRQNEGDRIWLEEKLHEMLEKLLHVHLQVHKEMEGLAALRASTREELYRRVHIGHDYMAAYYHTPISLTDIARTAALSPNHFLRNYKQLFGTSPYQFIKEKRLQEAKKLLLETEKSVTDICLEVGFESHSSFSMLFTKRFNVPPSQIRQKR